MPDLLASLQDVLGDRYRLEGELGRGGMATVYRAFDHKHSRQVAVKVLSPEIALMLGSDRFRREIAIAAALQHPGIVPLFDSGGSGDLLYYVMPLIGGESLRDRLERETQLPLDDALRIARDVAEALTYAHSQGVVHRDIKPENIMLASGCAVVADFGIARAIAEIGGVRLTEKLTEKNQVIGTPEYMSPEQAGGAEQIDGRSDQYSLACVLFEMLGGDPPFKGRTYQAILAKHMQERPPSLQVVRPTVKPGFQLVMEKALAKVPADRYATPIQFVAALDQELIRPSQVVPRPPDRRGKRAMVLGAVAGAAVVALLGWSASTGSWGFNSGVGSADVDTSRYVILPFEQPGVVRSGVRPEQLLHDAMARWQGVSINDAFQGSDTLSERRGVSLSRSEARAIAIGAGAGRYVRGELSQLGDSLRIHVSLHDVTAQDSQVAEKSVWVGADLRRAEPVFAGVADGLLFRAASHPETSLSPVGTTSAPARQAYLRGREAIEAWNLPDADTSFADAARRDPRFAEALLWLGQVRSWSGRPAISWQSAAERAAAGREGLSAHDRLLSDALLALSRGDSPRACGILAQLTRLNEHDFAAWYALGNCLSRDSVVLRNGRSRSGWSFRSSYHQATRAYERAFQIQPSIHRSLRGGSFAFVRKLLFTSGNALRYGRSAIPDTISFAASPSWEGDTLAFVPYPQSSMFSAAGMTSPKTALAIRRERERFRQIATAWATEFPGSADALEALAVALELLGDPAALDTLRRSRAQATSGRDQARIAGAEVWMRVRFAMPDNLRGLEAARTLADSILDAPSHDGSGEPLLLASLAALTGRAMLAAHHSRDATAAAAWGVPLPLSQTALPLVVLAAFGGPVDSLVTLERQVAQSIDNELPAADRAPARLQWLARAVSVEFPAHQSGLIGTLDGTGDVLIDAEAAFQRHDTAGARRALANIQVARRFLAPEDLTFDALYPEAALLSALGDDSAAIGRLDPTLDVLPVAAGRQAPRVVTDPVVAAAMIRAIVLRAELADRRGDATTARRWARVVAILWSSADPFLQPTVNRMKQLARSR